MRILIVQDEIEQAIRSHILNQISIKEGQEIKIDLKATRGDDGMTAEINIVTPGNEPQKPTQTATQSRSASTGTKTQATKPSTSPAPAVTATEATSSEPEVSADTASTTEAEAEVVNQKEETTPTSLFPAATKAFDADLPVDADSTTFATKPASQAAAEPSKSLFGNLTKPVNTPSV